jgi:hypothetical protein
MEDVMKHKAYFTNLVIDRPLSHFKGGGMAAASSLLTPLRPPIFLADIWWWYGGV